jgi:hypothetical protein
MLRYRLHEDSSQVAEMFYRERKRSLPKDYHKANINALKQKEQNLQQKIHQKVEQQKSKKVYKGP